MSRARILREGPELRIDLAFIAGVIGLLVVIGFVNYFPSLYERSLDAGVKNLIVAAIGGVCGWFVGRLLASSTVEHGKKLVQDHGIRIDDSKHSWMAERLWFGVILLLVAILLPGLAVSFQQGKLEWANVMTASGQVAKFGFTLAGAFIGHHFALKNQLKHLRALASEVSTRPPKLGSTE